MKFTVSSSTLFKQLAAISGAIVNNPVVPILENFLIEIRQGQLTATASDLQAFMTTTMSVETRKETNIAIPARILLDTLRNLPEQPVTFAIDEKTYGVTISASNGHYRLAGENATDFPKFMEVKDAIEVSMPAEVIKRAISQTIIATSPSELKPAMSGVYVDFRPQGVIFVSTDGHRLVRYTRSDIGVATQKPFIIPRKTLSLFSTLLQGEDQLVKIAFNDQHIQFKVANFSMLSRLIDEEYPSYENVIPAHNPHKLTVNRVGLLSSLKRICIYANKATQQVKLGLGDSQLRIFAEDFEFSNEASETLACEYEGDSLEIGINAKLLIELLNSLQVEDIEMHVADNTKPCLIYPKEKEDDQEDLLLLIMPLLVK